jgi:hydrogenase nickel incorporation protein HypA/HybF
VHELGIVFHIVKEVEAVCADNALTAVASVTLEVGEVSAIVDTYLTDCWNWAAAKSPVLKGAALRIETLPAVTLCDACGKTYPTVEHGKDCPACGSPETHLLSGDQITIKEIEAK